MARPIGALLAVALLIATRIAAAQVPPLDPVPPSIAASFPALTQEREALLAERAQLRARSDAHNARCSSVVQGSADDRTCQASQAKLQAALSAHVARTIALNDAIRVTDGILLHARELGWSDAEIKNLRDMLANLAREGDPGTPEQVQQVWRAMLARPDAGELARLAAMGQGPGFPTVGAGRQTHFEDCVIFALANTTNRPYGFVAARATRLISEGNWRTAAERSNPQAAIEGGGIMAGEVAMLAQVFGGARIVRSADFARTLGSGSPITVAVQSAGGGGHQVVLSKTFQNRGETWFELIDSNQGPTRRLYLSRAELDTVLLQNGIAFTPEANRTPALLR